MILETDAVHDLNPRFNLTPVNYLVGTGEKGFEIYLEMDLKRCSLWP